MHTERIRGRLTKLSHILMQEYAGRSRAAELQSCRAAESCTVMPVRSYNIDKTN